MLLVWLSLALLVLVVVVGAYHLFVRTRDVLRAFREFNGGSSAAMDAVGEAAARLAESTARLPEGGERLAVRLERFARTRAEFAVLTGAIGEVAELQRGVRAYVPKK